MGRRSSFLDPDKLQGRKLNALGCDCISPSAALADGEIWSQPWRERERVYRNSSRAQADLDTITRLSDTRLTLRAPMTLGKNWALYALHET